MLRVLFCGGGSLGHLTPSLSVWEALHAKNGESSCLFICSSAKEDRRYLRSAKVRFFPLHAPKWQISPKILLFPLLFPLACLEAACVLLFFRPHVIFSKGGYVSVPVCLVGWVFRRPIVLHESDRIMGRANRLLVRLSRHLCIGTPQKEIANGTLVSRIGLPVSATGNPIRATLLHGSRDGGRRVTGFSGKRPVLLVIGGSQGAQALNTVVTEHLEKLLLICDIVHITGRGKGSAKTHGRYVQKEVVFEELQHLYALADLVVSRAGAGAIAELSALGKPTILVPLPDLAHRHQEENAHFLEVASAVVVLPQENLRKNFVSTVQNLLEDDETRRMLGERLQRFAVPDAADRIANVILETARK